LILDLHVHSAFSLDSPTRVEDYARRMVELREQYRLDGFVLMEHNRLLDPADCDLEAIGREYGLTILAGVEADTHWGHFLVYGLPPAIWNELQANGSRKQEPRAFTAAALAAGAVVAPAHPFRFFIGAGERCSTLPGIGVAEGLNGSNTDLENLAALQFIARRGWAAVGGSDAHFPAELGKALTAFERPVRNLLELTAELKAGRCRALRLAEARRD
jgi:predicted metal-dependent phosphoesterase TrpH